MVVYILYGYNTDGWSWGEEVVLGVYSNLQLAEKGFVDALSADFIIKWYKTILLKSMETDKEIGKFRQNEIKSFTQAKEMWERRNK